MDDDEGPIRDFVLILQGIHETVVEVEDRRDTHLIACVGLVLPEVSVSAQFVREIPKCDTGTDTTSSGDVHRTYEASG